MQKFVVSLLMIFSMSAQAKNTFSSPQLEQLAQKFVQAIDARQQPDTKIENIDHYISLLADDFIDEHIKFNFTYRSFLEHFALNYLPLETI